MQFFTYKGRATGSFRRMALHDGPQHQRLVDVRHPHLAFEEPTKRVEFKAHERDYGGQAGNRKGDGRSLAGSVGGWFGVALSPLGSAAA